MDLCTKSHIVFLPISCARIFGRSEVRLPVMSTISADDGVSSSSDSTNNSTLVIRASHHSLSPSVMLRQAMRDTNIRSLQFCSIRIGEVVADALTRLILSRHEQGNSIQSIKFLRCRLEELEDPIPLMTALRTVERIEFGWSSPIRFLSYCLSESFPSTSPQADTDKTAVERIPSETEDCCGISTLVLREAHIVDPMASGYPTFPSSTINQDEVTIYHVVK